MAKGNKPRKNDKKNKKPKGAKSLGVKKASAGNIFSRSGDSAMGNM